jgi:hypothetical protein
MARVIVRVSLFTPRKHLRHNVILPFIRYLIVFTFILPFYSFENDAATQNAFNAIIYFVTKLFLFEYIRIF